MEFDMNTCTTPVLPRFFDVKKKRENRIKMEEDRHVAKLCRVFKTIHEMVHDRVSSMILLVCI